VDLLSYLGNVEGIAMDFLRPVGRASRSMQPEATMAANGIEAAINALIELLRWADEG